MYKFLCTNIAKSRVAVKKLNQLKKTGQQECQQASSTSTNYVDENQDEVFEKDNNGKKETHNRFANPFPLVLKLPSFRNTIQPAPNPKMKETPRFYTGNFLIFDSPTPSISKKYYHHYSINLSKRMLSTMNCNKRFVNDASRENYRREMEQLSSIQRKKCDFQFRPMNISTKLPTSTAEFWTNRNKKKINKTEISYPTHTVKHNLTLSKRYRIREGSVEKKVKELEDKFKHRKKLQLKMFKTKRLSYPTLVEHVMKKGKFNTITVENSDPKKPQFQWQPSNQLKIEVVKFVPEQEECQKPDVSESLEAKDVDEQFRDLIKSHPQIEHASKEVKMKLKNKFMQLLINPVKKRRAPPPRTETNEETEKKSTKSEDSKSCKAEEKYPNQVKETVQTAGTEKENITTHPQIRNVREVSRTSADVRHAVWVDDGNNFDLDKVCMKETATKIGSGLISREYAKETPKPNYKKVNEEAQEVPNLVLKQKSAKCKLIKENSKPNYKQIEQEAKDLSNFIGKMKISKIKNDCNLRLEQKTEDTNKNLHNDLKEKQKLNTNENISPRIIYGQPKPKLQKDNKWINHPNNPAVMVANKIEQAVQKETTSIKNVDAKTMDLEKSLAESTHSLPLTKEDKAPKELIVDELMKNPIKINESNVVILTLAQDLDEVTQVDELNNKAKAAVQKFIRRKLKNEQQKQRNDIKDKTSSLEIHTRYDKSEDRLKEKVEIAKINKRKIEELELVIDREENKAPKTRVVQEEKLEETTKYEELNNIAENLIKKRKLHQPGQSFTVKQMNSQRKLKKDSAKIEDNEVKLEQDKRVKQNLEEPSWRKNQVDPNITQIIGSEKDNPETGGKVDHNYNKAEKLKKDADNVEDIVLYPELIKEEINDNLTTTVTPQTKKLLVDEINDTINHNSIIKKSVIDESVMLKPGPRNAVNAIKNSEVFEKALAQDSRCDSKALQDTRSKIDMMLHKIGELENMIKMQHVQKTENMPRIPPPNYRPQIDKDKKNKNIKGDPRPKGHHDMILPSKKIAPSEAIAKEFIGNEVCKSQVSGNIPQANQLRVKSVQSNLLANSSSGNMNKLPSLVKESIVKQYLKESDNILLKDNGYFLSKINGPSVPMESDGVAIPLEKGIFQEVDTNHQEIVEKYFETKFGNSEDLSLSYSTVNVFNTIMESIPKIAKIERVVAAGEPKPSTKMIYSKTDVFGNREAAVEKHVNNSKISISKTFCSQNPINQISAQNLIKQASVEKASQNQVQNSSKKASTNQNLSKKACTNQNSASTNQIRTQNPPKKASTNNKPKVSVVPNHDQARNNPSTNKRIISCPPAKGKTLTLIMHSHGRVGSNKRASSFQSKDSDNTKIGIGVSKTKYSSWSTKNSSSDKGLDKNASIDATSKLIGSKDAISSGKPEVSVKPSYSKKSETAQSDQAKCYLNAEASSQNKNSAASKQEPIIELSKSKMHKAIKNQSLQLLQDAKSKIDKDIKPEPNIVRPGINEHFKPEQSEASFVEDGWVIGLEQLLAVNEIISNKSTNKLKQFKEDTNNVTLKVTKKDDTIDMNVKILPELCNQKQTGGILPENKVDIPCSADCNLCQANPIAVLKVTLPKLSEKSSLGSQHEHPMKMSGCASKTCKAGNSTTSVRHADDENLLKSKTPIKNVTASNKDNKDKKAIFGFKSNGEVFIIKKADESFGENKVMKSTTTEPIVKAEDADLIFKLQKLANKKMEMPKINVDSYITGKPNKVAPTPKLIAKIEEIIVTKFKVRKSGLLKRQSYNIEKDKAFQKLSKPVLKGKIETIYDKECLDQINENIKIANYNPKKWKSLFSDLETSNFQKIKNDFFKHGLNEDQELITFNKNTFKRSFSESKVEQQQRPLKILLNNIVKSNLQPKEKSDKPKTDLHEEIMQLNKRHASILKGIEQKLARKRQILKEKAQEIEQIKSSHKSSNENIVKLEKQSEKIEDSEKNQQPLKIIETFEEALVEVPLNENTAIFEPAKFEETKDVQKSLQNIETKIVEIKSTPKIASMLRIKKVKNQYEYFVEPPAVDVYALKEELKNVVDDSLNPTNSLIDDTVLSTRPQTAQINRTAKILVERSKTEATKLRQTLNLRKNRQMAAGSNASKKSSSEKQFVQKSSLQALKPTETNKLKELVTITTKVMSKEALESEIKAWIINFNKNKRAMSGQSVKVYEDPVTNVKPKKEKSVNKKLQEPESSKLYHQNTLEGDVTSLDTILKLYPLRKKPATVASRPELTRKSKTVHIKNAEYRSKFEKKTHREAIKFKKNYVADLNSQANDMLRKRKSVYRFARRQELNQNDGKQSQPSIGNSSYWGNNKLHESSSNTDPTGKRSYHNSSNISKDFNRLMSKKEYLEFKRLEAEENKKKNLLKAGNKSVDEITVATEMFIYKNKYGEKEKQFKTEKRKSVSAKSLPESINKGNSDNLLIQKTITPSMQIYKNTNQEKDNKPVNTKKELIHEKGKNNYEVKKDINRLQAKKLPGAEKRAALIETEMELYKNNDAFVKTTNVQTIQSEKNQIQKGPAQVNPTLEIIYKKNTGNVEKLRQNKKKDEILNNTVNSIERELKLNSQPLQTADDKKNKESLEQVKRTLNKKEIAESELRFANLTKRKKEKSKMVNAEKLIQNKKNDEILNNTVKKIETELKLNSQPLEIADDNTIKESLEQVKRAINKKQIAEAEVRFTNIIKRKKEKSEIVNSEELIQNKKNDEILNNTVKKIETELNRQPLADDKKIKESLKEVKKASNKKEIAVTNSLKRKKEKSETATNKTVSKLETNKPPSIQRKSQVDLYKKIEQEVEAQKKRKLKVDPPELTTDALNFKITKMTKLVIDDMKLKKLADIQFLEPGKVGDVSSIDPVASHKGFDKKEEKHKILKSSIKSDLKPKVSESTQNQPNKLRKSATVDLLEKSNSKTAPINVKTKKEIEKEPKKVTQQLKSASLGNMIWPKETDTAVKINMANKDGKSGKKPDLKKDKEEITPTFIFKRNLCKSPKRTQKTKIPPTIKKPRKKYGKKIVLPLRNIKEVNKEYFESYESTLDKPVGDKIKVVPKEISDIEKKKKMTSDVFWDQMKTFNPNKYKHLRISYMTVKKRPKRKEKFLPKNAQDMEEGKLSEEEKNRIINFRFELLKKLNEEFQKQVNEQRSNETPETSTVKNVNTIDKNTNKTMKPIGKKIFFSKIIKGKKTAPKNPDDTNNDTPKGSRRYSTNNNEQDDKTHVEKLISIESRLAMDSPSDNSKPIDINCELIQKINAFNILKAVPKAFESASPKLEKQRHKNLYYRTHSWTYSTLNEYLHDQRVFSVDAAEKKQVVDSDKQDEKK